MWFWCYVMALFVVALTGAVFGQFYWWSMVGTGVLWAVGVVVEAFLIWRQDRALGHEATARTPPNSLAAAMATEATSRKQA